MKIAVVGAGKMGLPLACQFASRGGEVIACDINPAAVAEINAGRCPIDEPGVAQLLASAVSSGRLRATTDTVAAVGDVEAVVVIVPALLTSAREADLSVLEAVSGQIAQSLRPGTLVSYETTVPVGSTRSRFRAILETSGLEAGRDFALVFSPERVKSQLVLEDLTGTPKVVGGIDAESAKRGAEFYGRYLGAPIDNVGTLEAAELVKLAGMLYRDVNIALANEISRYAEAVGIELDPVIAAANTDGEAHLLRPGIGVGGHCTPVYPYFLIHDGQARGVPMTLAERARRINDGQAAHVLDRYEADIGELRGRRVLILGLGFRPQVKEHLFSSAFLLREELLQRGAEVRLHDPLYHDDELLEHSFVPGKLLADRWPAEVLVLNTAHAAYETLNYRDLATAGVRYIIDGRNALDAAAAREAGIGYAGIGNADAARHLSRQAVIPVARPELGGPEAEAAADVVRSGWILQGPQVSRFEQEFAEYVAAPHACAVSSGTAALHLALLAAGVEPGDEVITVSHSFIATANSIVYCGAKPVFVDVRPDTLNIDPAAVERAITPRTRAILCVHQLGMPCDMATLVHIARTHNLPLIEDAACAVGSEIFWEDQWQRIGRPHGDVACFSFHPRKLLTTGDGGMITTARADWDEKFRLLRNHGMDASTAARAKAATVVFESYPVLGYNYRMTDVQAAIGREQLRRIPGQVAQRRALAARYREAIAARIPDAAIQQEPEWAHSNWQSLYVRFPEGIDQRSVIQQLHEQGIATRRGVMNAHEEEPYRHVAHPELDGSERAKRGGIVLPLYVGMLDSDIERVCGVLQSAVAAAGGRRHHPAAIV